MVWKNILSLSDISGKNSELIRVEIFSPSEEMVFFCYASGLPEMSVRA